MQIHRADYILAPNGDAVHAVGQAYTSRDGRGMIESVVHYSFDGNYYYSGQKYRRVSDDGGATWRIDGEVTRVDPTVKKTAEFTPARHLHDPHTGFLVAFYSDWMISTDESQFTSHTTSRSYRIHYRISRDAGRTWEPARQVIHKGAEFDSTHWMPNITYGKNGGYVESCVPLTLDDGTIVIGMVTEPVDAAGNLYRPGGSYWFNTGFLRGNWTRDHDAIEWTVSPWLTTTLDVSSVGLCEPDVIDLGGNRLFATMRCQGDPARGLMSSRQGSSSNDGGKTWTAARPITYDDGRAVHVPAAYSAFLRSPRTGKIYWFANILDRAVPAQYPRCPLVMIELDPKRLCFIRATQKVIQDLPPGAPACASDLPTTDEECGRQYTNFGSYVDRETGEMVIVVPEMPKRSWAEFTSDCITIRVRD